MEYVVKREDPKIIEIVRKGLYNMCKSHSRRLPAYSLFDEYVGSSPRISKTTASEVSLNVNKSGGPDSRAQTLLNTNNLTKKSELEALLKQCGMHRQRQADVINFVNDLLEETGHDEAIL